MPLTDEERRRFREIQDRLQMAPHEWRVRSEYNWGEFTPDHELPPGPPPPNRIERNPETGIFSFRQDILNGNGETIHPHAFDGHINTGREIRLTADAGPMLEAMERFTASLERFGYTPSPQLVLPLRDRRRSWESKFQEDTIYRDFEIENPDDVRNPINEPSMTVEEDRMAKRLTLREVAEKLPPGILGMHYEGTVAKNLIFRPQDEDDPRKRLLKESGWFEVRNFDRVWFSAPTLESWNTLVDTDMPFKQTQKVAAWHYQITRSDLSTSFNSRLKDSPLFDYQQDAVRFLFHRERAMLSLSPGLGKTLTSAFAAGLVGHRYVLLVCPASLLHYWHAELTKWGPQLPLQPMPEIWHKETGTLPTHLPEGSQFWAITNPETLTRFASEFVPEEDLSIPRPKFELLVVDESIMYKHRESLRSQKLNDIAQDIPATWLLTGAPATRYLDDLWHQFHILNNRGYSSYWRFAKRYCKVEETPWAKTVIANQRDAEEEIKENFEDIYFSRSQEQVADIPDWIMEDIDLPMTQKQEAAYRKLQKELIIEIGDKDDSETITIDNRFNLILRSLQLASNPVLVGGDNTSGKWSALPDLMAIYPGPYIIWVNFIRTGEMILDMLKQMRMPNDEDSIRSMRACLINGSTPMLDRNVLVDAFQAGKYDVVVMNSSVGKFGFTMTKARTAFYLERGYDDSYYQSLFRFRRIGTKLSPIVVNMRSVTASGNRTIDHVVHDALSYRNSMIKQLTIGDLRGILDE